MLIERDHPRRDTRWFVDAGLELHVWLDPDGTITGFQLAVNGARLMVWTPAGWESLAVHESGDTRSLRAAEPFDAASLLLLFVERAAEVDEPIRRFVCEKLLGALVPQSRSGPS